MWSKKRELGGFYRFLFIEGVRYCVSYWGFREKGYVFLFFKIF